MRLVVPGIPYTSKQALGRVKELVTVQEPHVTPDGKAILAVHTGGGPVVAVDGKPVEQPAGEWHWVVFTADGFNLEHAVSDKGHMRAVTALFPLDAFGDVERLVEYDHLPESRKDYTVYPRGHKLA